MITSKHSKWDYMIILLMEIIIPKLINPLYECIIINQTPTSWVTSMGGEGL